MIRRSILCPIILLHGTVSSFILPTKHVSSSHLHTSSPLLIDQNTDPFDDYNLTPQQTTIATRDKTVGTGTPFPTGSSSVKVQFTAKLMGSKFTSNIKEFTTESTVFQTGEQRILPGLEEGLTGMNVGGRRIVRVPPNRGYGDNWYRGVVPPNSHLEFDLTLLDVAEGPMEEFGMKLEQFGVERALGAGVCLAFMALSPMLEKSGVL